MGHGVDASSLEYMSIVRMISNAVRKHDSKDRNEVDMKSRKPTISVLEARGARKFERFARGTSYKMSDAASDPSYRGE